MTIHLIPHEKIDKKKYDECINNASNGVIYALSWYLDITSPRWQLLTTSDYSYVMPLPIKKKFGISYIVQPLMCQQLGVFSSEIISEKILLLFFNKIKVPYCNMHFNTGNIIDSLNFSFRSNYVLDISKDYDFIKRGYHKNTKYSLKKGLPLNVIISDNNTLESLFNFISKDSEIYAGALYDIIKELIIKAQEKNMLKTLCIQDIDSREILSAVCIFAWQDKLYYCLSVSSPRGKEIDASRFLIDAFISQNAENNKIFDFEGSSIPSIAMFFRSFGAKDDPYPVFYKNKLPAFLKLFKKLNR